MDLVASRWRPAIIADMVEALSAELPVKMTVETFLAWVQERPGRYELELGRVVAMSPERASHNRAKTAAQRALERAIARAGVACESFSDGMTVRIDASTAYEPDAVVRCGPTLPPDAIEIPNAVIVVEVSSPSTGRRDEHEKLIGYFAVLSIQHYLIVYAERRIIVHHARSGDAITTRIIGSGTIRLDPPGLDLAVEDLFGTAELVSG